MKVQGKVFTIIVIVLCLAALAGCSLLRSDGPYYSGSLLSGESILEQFSLTGTPASVEISGSKGLARIHIQQMANSGWVAWAGRNYVYTSNDVGRDRILCEACRRFFGEEEGNTAER